MFKFENNDFGKKHGHGHGDSHHDDEKEDEKGPKFYKKMRDKKMKQDTEFDQAMRSKQTQHRINKMLYGRRESVKILAIDETKETERCVEHGHAH